MSKSIVKKESVKSICEEAIRNGSAFGVIMNKLRKKFDKDDATYERSIKYYASGLHRAKEIDDATKSKYVGEAGRGNKSKGASKAAAKTAKRASKKSESKADGKIKKSRKSKSTKDLKTRSGTVKKEKKERKSRKKSEAQS